MSSATFVPRRLRPINQRKSQIANRKSQIRHCGIQVNVATLPLESVNCIVAPRERIWKVVVSPLALMASTPSDPSGFTNATFSIPT